jgi:hypothetical protein
LEQEQFIEECKNKITAIQDLELKKHVEVFEAVNFMAEAALQAGITPEQLVSLLVYLQATMHKE